MSDKLITIDEEKLHIALLDKDKMADIYRNHMVHDFPDNERKPLAMIIKGMEKGTYECIGLTDGVSILAYAIFVKNGNDYLFDYLAVINGNRNGGLGSIFLRRIAEYFSSARTVIGEVEDFDCAKSDDDKHLQERRYAFYLRNGYIDTGVKVKLFGVDYKVLRIDNEGSRGISSEEIKELYKMHYKAMLPTVLYKTMVKVKG